MKTYALDPKTRTLSHLLPLNPVHLHTGVFKSEENVQTPLFKQKLWHRSTSQFSPSNAPEQSHLAVVLFFLPPFMQLSFATFSRRSRFSSPSLTLNL